MPYKKYIWKMVFEYKQKKNWNYSFVIAKDYKDDFLKMLQKWAWENIKCEFIEVLKS